MHGKECASTCGGCLGEKHSCTPPLGGPEHPGVHSIANSEALKVARKEGGRLIFSGAENSTGWVCDHAKDAAEFQWTQVYPNTPVPKKARGRPKKVTPDRPATRVTPGTPARDDACWSCLTGPRARIMVQNRKRPGRATFLLSTAGCLFVGKLPGTQVCSPCSKFIERKAENAEREKRLRVQNMSTADKIEMVTLLDHATLLRPVLAQLKLQPRGAAESKAAILDFVDDHPEQAVRWNRDMQEHLCTYDLPDDVGIKENFHAFVRTLGIDPDSEAIPYDVANQAKVMLAMQADQFCGSHIGRGNTKKGEKKVILNGFQSGIAYLVKYGSDDTTLRALNKPYHTIGLLGVGGGGK